METDTHACQSSPKRRRVGSSPEPSDNMSSLLEDEYFLLMIFEHLVDYGLHDCRLVCRRWHKVCQQFPLQLKDVTGDQLGMIAAFPNATSVSMKSTEQTIPATEFFGRLASLSNLRSLSLGSGRLLDGWTDSGFFEKVTQLTDLKIEYLVSDLPDKMIASIKYLTNLTRLTVHGGGLWTGAPVTFLELKKIRELHVYLCHFVGEQGACLFPSLTNLTRLELSGGVSRMATPVVSLQAISLYATTLEYLSLSLVPCGELVDFAALTSLERLRTLKVDGLCTRQGGFIEILPQLRSVARLNIHRCDCLTQAMQDAIAACTGLNTLCCPQSYLHDSTQAEIPLLPRVTQLTKLAATVGGKSISELSCLTRLTHLSLEVSFIEDCSLDEALRCMPNLQDLDVTGRNSVLGNDPDAVCTLELSGEVFAHMDHLRSVSVVRIDVSESFFRELASKTELTRLEFIACNRMQYTRSFISQVNLLKNLEELMLRLPAQRNICNWISPTHLTKLKRLNVSGTRRHIRELRGNFSHSRFSVLVNQRMSPWCSRLTA